MYISTIWYIKYTFLCAVCPSEHVGVRGQLWEPVLSFHVGYWAQIQVTGLVGKCLYILSHLTGPPLGCSWTQDTRLGTRTMGRVMPGTGCIY